MQCNVELYSAVLHLAFQPTGVVWVLEVAILYAHLSRSVCHPKHRMTCKHAGKKKG